MAWIWLTVAGLLEIVWAVGLKYTDGFTRLWPSAITLAAMVASVYCLAVAVRTIPIGTGYAVWTGIGAVGVAIDRDADRADAGPHRIAGADGDSAHGHGQEVDARDHRRER